MPVLALVRSRKRVAPHRRRQELIEVVPCDIRHLLEPAGRLGRAGRGASRCVLPED